MDQFCQSDGFAVRARCEARRLRLRLLAWLKPLLVLRYALLAVMNVTLMIHALFFRRTISPLPWLYLYTAIAAARLALAAYYSGKHEMRPLVLEVPNVPGLAGAGSAGGFAHGQGKSLAGTNFIVSEVDLWVDLFLVWCFGLFVSFLHLDKGLWSFLGFVCVGLVLFCICVIPGYLRISKVEGRGGVFRILRSSAAFMLQRMF